MAGAPVIDVQVAAGMPFAEAAEAFGSRVPVLTPSVLNSAREFWLSQRAIAAAPVRRTLTKMAQDYLQRYLSGGADSRKGFTQWLSEQNVGITDHYAETVRRAALGNSFSEGRLKQMTEHNDRVRSLGGADDVVGFRLMSAGDAAVRPEHAALDGIAFPLTQAGLRFMPPNGWGCRCTYAPVFADEGAQLATEAEMQALERFVDDGWLNAPSSIIDERANLASRAGRVKLADDPAGTRWITTENGRRVLIDGDGTVVKGLSKEAEGKNIRDAVDELAGIEKRKKKPKKSAKEIASKVGEGLKSVPGKAKTLPKNITDKLSTFKREFTEKKRGEVAALIEGGMEPRAALRKVVGKTAYDGLVGAVKGVGRTIKNEVLGAKQKMVAEGIPRAIAWPVAIASGVTAAAPVSAGTMALTAMGQGWVNLIPGFTVAESKLIPGAVIAPVKAVRNISTAIKNRRKRKAVRRDLRSQGIAASAMHERIRLAANGEDMEDLPQSVIDAALDLGDVVTPENEGLVASFIMQVVAEGLELDEALIAARYAVPRLERGEEVDSEGIAEAVASELGDSDE